MKVYLYLTTSEAYEGRGDPLRGPTAKEDTHPRHARVVHPRPSASFRRVYVGRGGAGTRRLGAGQRRFDSRGGRTRGGRT